MQTVSTAGDLSTRSHACVSALVCLFLFVALTLLGSPVSTSGQRPELPAINSLIRRGNLPEADRRLNLYLKTHPRSPKANELLGTLCMQQGRFQQAEKAFQHAVELEPSLLNAHIGLGDALIGNGKFDAALAAYHNATKIAPQDARANLSIAKLYLGAGEFSKSLQAAEKIPAGKRTAELLPTLAAAYFGLKQPEKGAVEIQFMLQIADKQPDLVPELAEFFMAHRDFKSSQQLLTIAKDKQPATDRYLIALALTQAGLGQLDDAQATVEEILARRPDSIEALIAAGKVAALQSNWEASGEAFARADRLALDRPDILYGLVSAQVRTSRPEAALANAQKLHKLAPDDLRVTYLLTLASFGARKWEDAKKFSEKILSAHPEDREMNLVLADIALNNEHNLPSARGHANAVLSLNPNDPSGLYYLGMIQKMEGDVKEAIQTLSKSVAFNPQNADAQGALGALCLQAGDLLRAVPALEQAALLAPEEPRNHFQLALAYSRAGAPEKANAELQKYQEMKAKEAKDAREYKGPSTSQVPSMGISSRP